MEFRYPADQRDIRAGTTQETTQKATQEPGYTPELQNVKDQPATQETTQEIPLRILAIIRENPTVTRREIASLLKDITEDGVKYHLNKLKSVGRIRHVGPTKRGRWEILDESNARRE